MSAKSTEEPGVLRECRVCHQALYPEPLLCYENMPKSAQFFPDELTLDEDKGENLSVYQCSACGLVQLGSEPVHYYKEVIRAAGISDEMVNFRQKQFGEWLQSYSLNNKKIVEIGCGAGEFLSIMQGLNIDSYGIEQRSESVYSCIEQGLNVEQDFVSNEIHKLAQAPFDAFYMLNFLEHLPNPNLTLKGISHNLVDGAVGLIEVPNFDMILRKNLFSEFISDHLFYFTQETLTSTLSINGFEVIECKETWHDYSLSVVVKKRAKMDLAIFTQHQEKLKNDFEIFISQFSEKTVAVWGAGHQSLAVISLAQIEKKIKYVIDSAPFKQGKFTPATHIPIVSPDTIKSNPVEAIIVMAASYSNEVIRIIRSKYGDGIKCAVLNGSNLEIILL